MSGGSATSEIQASSDSSFSDPSFSNIENVSFCLRLQDGSEKIARYGDVVWGMQDGFPWWPVLLCDPKIMNDLTGGAAESRSKSNEKNLLVFFFSTCEWAFIRPRNISHWHTSFQSRCLGSFVKPQDTDGSKKKKSKRVRLTKSVRRELFFWPLIESLSHTHTHTHTTNTVTTELESCCWRCNVIHQLGCEHSIFVL